MARNYALEVGQTVFKRAGSWSNRQAVPVKVIGYVYWGLGRGAGLPDKHYIFLDETDGSTYEGMSAFLTEAEAINA